MRLFTELGQACLDLLFPIICVGCGQVGELLCADCAQLVEPMPEDVCERCGRPMAVGCSFWCQQADPPLQLFRAAASYYVPPLHEAIHQFKYNNQPELASDLAKYLVASFDASCWTPIRNTITAVAPIPGDPKRKQERGYNQAELLADAFCDARHLPLYTELLEKVETTESQTSLSWSERTKNVEGKYIASPNMAGHHLLLIDDVSTSGATMATCSSAALSAGAACVYGLSIAMPLRDHDS